MQKLRRCLRDNKCPTILLLTLEKVDKTDTRSHNIPILNINFSVNIHMNVLWSKIQNFEGEKKYPRTFQIKYLSSLSANLQTWGMVHANIGEFFEGIILWNNWDYPSESPQECYWGKWREYCREIWSPWLFHKPADRSFISFPFNIKKGEGESSRTSNKSRSGSLDQRPNTSRGFVSMWFF